MPEVPRDRLHHRLNWSFAADKGDYENALNLVDGDTVVLSAKAEIAAYGYSAAAISGAFLNTLVLDGRVHSRI